MLHSLLKVAGLSIPNGLIDVPISQITCDSRTASKGCLFLGLPGERVDGGIYWREALEAGAVAAIIGKSAAQKKPPSSSKVVVVLSDEVANWIGKIASAFWQNPSSKISLIGVTGTNGKTTTTHLIEHLSKAAGRETALFGTLVNRWPTYSSKSVHTTQFADKLQEQLAQALKAGATMAAMEVSSHSLAQHRVAGCQFAGAVFTNLSQDHLDYHSSMQNYFETKANLFSPTFLDSERSCSVINIDDSWGSILAERLNEKCWRSSLKDDSVISGRAELTITNLIETPNRIKGRLITPMGEGDFISPLIGSFNLMNLLQAIGVLLQQGFTLKSLLEATESFPGVPGRMERIELDQFQKVNMPTVIVDYAHTPDGLKNALKATKSFTKGELICVFGCGGDRDRGKRPKMGEYASKYADKLIFTSDNPRTEDPEQIFRDVLDGIPPDTQLVKELNRSIAIDIAISQSSPDDVVLVAGKGHEDYQILGNKKIPFDDRLEVRRALIRKTI